jgi:hypothetical protein
VWQAGSRALLIELIFWASSGARLIELKRQAGSCARLVLEQPDVVALANNDGVGGIGIWGANNLYPPGRSVRGVW